HNAPPIWNPAVRWTVVTQLYQNCTAVRTGTCMARSTKSTVWPTHTSGLKTPIAPAAALCLVSSAQPSLARSPKADALGVLTTLTGGFEDGGAEQKAQPGLSHCDRPG